jgi:hypothetical protein
MMMKKRFHFHNVSKLMLIALLSLFSLVIIAQSTFASHYDSISPTNLVVSGNLKLSAQLFEGESLNPTDRIAYIQKGDTNERYADGFQWLGCTVGQEVCLPEDQVRPGASRLYTLLLRNEGSMTGHLTISLDRQGLDILQAIPGYETVTESLWTHTKFSRAIGNVGVLPSMPLTTTLAGFATVFGELETSVTLTPTNPKLALLPGEAVIILLYFEIEDLDNSFNEQTPTYGFAANIDIGFDQVVTN